jgi:hypothetical protein
MGGLRSPIRDLKSFAKERHISILPQSDIIREAISRITYVYGGDPLTLKANFDRVISDAETLAYKIYIEKELTYGSGVLNAFALHLIESGEIRSLNDLPAVLGDHFKVMDRFYLSIAQSRKSRAGKGFEDIHNTLFSRLGYPFTAQAVINGKPDFIMPSVEYYKRNPMDSIIFTAKRTLRERWRQIVTEGTRGLGFYLATIDPGVSSEQLGEMMSHRIYMVVPESLKTEKYNGRENVISFMEFFRDHLDPRMDAWRRKGVI